MISFSFSSRTETIQSSNLPAIKAHSSIRAAEREGVGERKKKKERGKEEERKRGIEGRELNPKRFKGGNRK